MEGLVALKRSNPREALKDFTDATKLLDSWIARFDLGRAYVDAGAFAEATSELDRCVTRRGETLALFLDEVPTSGYFPAVYYYQGRAQEGLGSPAAADSYRKFVSVREQGEAGGLLQDAKARLVKLAK